MKKCWICFSDSTEDTPETSPWRDPCPCALVAHEDCLLDWIADMEAPNNRRSRSVAAPKIECPQCKSEIKLARPKDWIVEGVRGMERLGAQVVTPGALAVVTGTLYHTSMLWGVHSIYAVFGADDGIRILRPMILNVVRPPLELNTSTPRDVGDRLLGLAVDHLVHWRLYVGLPLITPMLVLSRTTLADSILPVLPVLFFATQTHSPQDTLDFTQWPPSASLAFAVLPYLRLAYNAYYKRVWGEREQQWLREIQPRLNQSQNEADDNADNANDAEDADNVFEVRLDTNIFEDWEGGDEEDEMPDLAAVPVEAVPAAAPQQGDREEFHEAVQRAEDIVNEAPGEHAEPVENPAGPGARPQEPAVAAPDDAAVPPPAPGERRLSFSPSTIAETLLGALLFPTIAGLSGELLKLALPTRFTRASRSGGILQAKWGRSLVGGCLFVVVKDAVGLYVKWRMARMQRDRRVLDYRGPRTRNA